MRVFKPLVIVSALSLAGCGAGVEELQNVEGLGEAIVAVNNQVDESSGVPAIGSAIFGTPSLSLIHI